MKKQAVSKYVKKLLDQDPNNIFEFDVYECRMPNDFVKWSDLSGEVVTYKLSKEELELYLKGELRLWLNVKVL